MCKDQILDFARVDPKNKIQISRKKYYTELVLKFLNILSTKKYLKPKIVKIIVSGMNSCVRNYCGLLVYQPAPDQE